MHFPVSLIQKTESVQAAGKPAAQVNKPASSVGTDARSLADQHRRVNALRGKLNDCIYRADALKSRAEAVVATNAPSKAHKDYAEQLFEESRSLRRKAYEIKCELDEAEHQLQSAIRRSEA